jgi:hypothetical protein
MKTGSISSRRTSPSRQFASIVFGLCCFWASAGNAAGRAVAVPEAVIRSAPFEVAPEIARVHAGDILSTDEHAQGAWRRVRFSDGRYGFIRDADAPVPAADPLPPLPPPPPSPRPTVAVRAAAAPSPPSEPMKLGVMFSLLPTGTLSSTVSNDSVFAMAVAPFFDVGVSPYFAIGLSPQVVFRVKGDGVAGESAKEFDLRARLTVRAPVSPGVAAFARLSQGYSIIALPSAPTASSSQANSTGAVVDFSVGTEVALVPRLFLTVDLGYQVGFQSSGDSDLKTRYLHIGAGLAIAL